MLSLFIYPLELRDHSTYRDDYDQEQQWISTETTRFLTCDDSSSFIMALDTFQIQAKYPSLWEKLGRGKGVLSLSR